MDTQTIEGPVISFISSDQKAKDKAAQVRYTAAAFKRRDGKTIIIVKCDFGSTPELFAQMIAKDYKNLVDLKMSYLAHNTLGAEVCVINYN
jgi:hypothetical protein